MLIATDPLIVADPFLEKLVAGAHRLDPLLVVAHQSFQVHAGDGLKVFEQLQELQDTMRTLLFLYSHVASLLAGVHFLVCVHD